MIGQFGPTFYSHSNRSRKINHTTDKIKRTRCGFVVKHVKITFHSYPHVHITKINNFSFCQINSVLFSSVYVLLKMSSKYIYGVKKIFIFLIFLLVKHHQIQPNIIILLVYGCFVLHLGSYHTLELLSKEKIFPIEKGLDNPE